MRFVGVLALLVACPKSGPGAAISKPVPIAASGDLSCGLTYALPGTAERVWDAVRLSDGTIALLATSRADGDDQALLLVTDDPGVASRSVRFGGPDYDEPRTLTSLGADGWFVSGLSWRKDRQSDPWVASLGADGALRAERTFGDETMAFSAGHLPDGAGGYWLSSVGALNGLIGLDGALTTGRMIFVPPAGAPSTEAVAPAADGGGLLVGGVSATPTNTHGAWAARVAPDGAIRWSQTYDVPGYDILLAAARHGDGWVVAGQRDDPAIEGIPAWIAHLDDAGAIRWAATVDGAGGEHVRGVTALDDGRVLLYGGRSADPDQDDPDEAWIVAFGADGTRLWEALPAGGAAVAEVFAVGDRLIVVGTRSGEADPDLWRVDLDASGGSRCP